MIDLLLILVPLLPLLGAIFTVAFGGVLGRRSHVPAVISIGAALVCAILLLMGTAQVVSHETHGSIARPIEMISTLWQWASVEGAQPFSIPVALRVDPLTATMLTIITSVGLLVAIYSIGYMHNDPGYPRFFALVSAFVFSMSMLVAASNFLLVYVFWEAVGACSYLLIGFWFHKPEAAKAAKKAFLVNRVGDFGLAVAVFLLWMTYGTLNFHDTLSADGVIMPGILGQTRLADASGYIGGLVGTGICLLLLLAACGKSAQLPLHIWLPDAMEGPTPASALIHAATMVTAGIYLIARSCPLFVVCPDALAVVSVVGATTALIAALIGTVQNDLKRVLAYSTISQLGYMFASLGTGTLLGFTAAIFHLLTHAFFKALLFMGAGSVMHAMGGVIDMRRFGGLRRIMPITATTFLIGALALAGIAPFSGFFSKDEILASLHSRGWPNAHHVDHGDTDHAFRPHHNVFHHASQSKHSPTQVLSSVHFTPDKSNLFLNQKSPQGLVLDHPVTYRTLFWMALFTAGLTAFYTFRAVFMTFTGPTRVPEEAGDHAHESPAVMTAPLILLAIASAISGWFLFSTHALSDFLSATPSFTAPAIVATATKPVFHWNLAIQGSVAAFIGLSLAAYGHFGRRSDGPQIERFLGPIQILFARKFFFDEIYDVLVVRSLKILSLLSAFFDNRIIDGLVHMVARIPLVGASFVRQFQSGLLQRYALAGVVGVLAIVVALAWQLRS